MLCTIVPSEPQCEQTAHTSTAEMDDMSNNTEQMQLTAYDSFPPADLNCTIVKPVCSIVSVTYGKTSQKLSRVSWVRLFNNVKLMLFTHKFAAFITHLYIYIYIYTYTCTHIGYIDYIHIYILYVQIWSVFLITTWSLTNSLSNP